MSSISEESSHNRCNSRARSTCCSIGRMPLCDNAKTKASARLLASRNRGESRGIPSKPSTKSSDGGCNRDCCSRISTEKGWSGNSRKKAKYSWPKRSSFSLVCCHLMRDCKRRAVRSAASPPDLTAWDHISALSRNRAAFQADQAARTWVS